MNASSSAAKGSPRHSSPKLLEHSSPAAARGSADVQATRTHPPTSARIKKMRAAFLAALAAAVDYDAELAAHVRACARDPDSAFCWMQDARNVDATCRFAARVGLGGDGVAAAGPALELRFDGAAAARQARRGDAAADIARPTPRLISRGASDGGLVAATRERRRGGKRRWGSDAAAATPRQRRCGRYAGGSDASDAAAATPRQRCQGSDAAAAMPGQRCRGSIAAAATTPRRVAAAATPPPRR